MNEEIKNRNIWVYDLETFKYLFVAVFFNIDTLEYKVFECSSRRNHSGELRKFLYSGIKLIGFNNINFDYPVLHHTFLKDNNTWKSEDIFKISSSIIKAKYSSIWDNQTKIPQLDLYKIWHYDNKNKSTSLKWLEFAMRSENVQDLPYPVDMILSNQEMDEIIEYCKNDIKATYDFYKLSLKHIDIRQYYTQLEGINLMNASETKIAKDVFGKYLAKDLGIDYKELRTMRTERDEIVIKDIIFPYIKFKHKQNIEVLDYYNSVIWHKPKESKDKEDSQLKYSIDYLNVKREFGEGGLHSFGKAGIFESNDDYIVYDLDFKIAESRHSEMS